VKEIKKIAVVHERASFYGGAEEYLIELSSFLGQKNIKIDLYYSPEFHPSKHFTDHFDKSFILLDPINQLKNKYDILYIQNYKKNFHQLTKKNLGFPVFKFIHDHHHFCLRRSKIKAFDSSTCEKTVGAHCYACPGMAYKESGSLVLNTLKKLRSEHQFLQELNGLIVGSKYLDKHIRRHKISAKKLFINPLYPSSEEGKFNRTPLKERKQSILFAGSLIKGKGVDILLRSYAQAQSSFKLYIAGDGQKKEEYESLAQSLGIKKQVKFLGRVSKKELEKYYKEVKAHIVPSTFPETFSKVGIDGAVYGSLPICSEVGAINSWLKNKQNGLLFKSGDVDALSKILKSLENGDYDHLTPNAPRSFTKNNHFKRLIKIWKQSINQFEDYPNYSYDENNQFVSLMDELNKFVTGCTLKVIPKEKIQCIILIGGYGRGEGGVIQKENSLIPHNNLDYNIITNGLIFKNKDYFRKRILNLINENLPHEDITIDISINEKFKIQYAETKLIYYDMKFGHRLAFGNDQWLKALNRINPKNIPIFDMRELILNRGMLLLLNEQILKKKNLKIQDKKIIVRHIVKAIIGFGDGLLFAHGRYHWSYKRKSQLMLQIESLYPEYSKLYQEAIKFRFNPNYDKYINRDLSLFNQYIIKRSEDAHLNFEKLMQKKAQVNWDDFLESMLVNPFFNEKFTLLKLAKTIKNVISTKNIHLIFDSKEFFCFGFWHKIVGPRKQLVALFPYHLYRHKFPDSVKNVNKNKLDLGDFITLWGGAGDINFSHSMPAKILDKEIKKQAS